MNDRETAANRHFRDIVELAKIWDEKPLLRQIYHDFYLLIERWLSDIVGDLLEIGAGCGGMKSLVPNCIATDLFPSPWVDRCENVYALSLTDDSLANLVMVDVFHHLRFPGDALAECSRVLLKGGRLIIFEPDIGALGLLVYGLFHHEPLGLRNQIQWHQNRCKQGEELESVYYAAQANANRIFVRHLSASQLKDWNVLNITRMAAFSYLASGGFRNCQLYPQTWYAKLKIVDRMLDRFPSLFSTRMLVVLEKKW
ncbi:MAG: methyltransferase domain-containing protein [Planctomycetota bacterium]|jgi:SAM-dependent methyltransferase|nr:methyltransferase domain-containing protein [Planctomycetota bacterium]